MSKDKPKNEEDKIEALEDRCHYLKQNGRILALDYPDYQVGKIELRKEIFILQAKICILKTERKAEYFEVD
ncbi:MAG: hypothetical protein ACYTBJ_27070 [Planctomycetota bacterium]|jgi:hypothetical protein